MLSYPFLLQKLIVSATMALHNFVKINDKDDEDFKNSINVPSYAHDNEGGDEDNSDPQMVNLRDNIAKSISGL